MRNMPLHQLWMFLRQTGMKPLVFYEELAYQNMRKQKDGGTMPWRSVVLGKSVPRTRQSCGLCVCDDLFLWLSTFIYDTSFSFIFSSLFCL
jgi:hypothetical protein